MLGALHALYLRPLLLCETCPLPCMWALPRKL